MVFKYYLTDSVVSCCF